MVGLVACLFAPSVRAQKAATSKAATDTFADPRPDLWVVTLNAQTVDKHPSKVNRLTVINALTHGAHVRSQDTIVILHAGITDTLKGDFLSSFIRQCSKPVTLHQIHMNEHLLEGTPKANLLYPYLARPFSLYALIQSGFDFSPYRHINHILINEHDGTPKKEDDLKAVNKRFPDKYNECIKILRSVESWKLKSKSDGKFSKLDAASTANSGTGFPAYTTFSRYITYDDIHTKEQDANDLIEVSKFRRGLIVFTLKDSSAFFLRVKKVSVNGVQVMGPTFVSGQKLKVHDRQIKPNRQGNDTIEVTCNLLRHYDNTILGRRSRVLEASPNIIQDAKAKAGRLAIPLPFFQGNLASCILILDILLAAIFLLILLITRFRRKNGKSGKTTDKKNKTTAKSTLSGETTGTKNIETNTGVTDGTLRPDSPNRHPGNYALRIIFQNKDYRISRKALRKMIADQRPKNSTNDHPYCLMQVIDDLIFTYLDTGITVKTLENRKTKYPDNVYLITNRKVGIFYEGTYAGHKGLRNIKKQDFYADIPREGRLEMLAKTVHVFEWEDRSEAIQFSIDGQKFRIESKAPETITDSNPSEPFLFQNKQVLAEHWTERISKISFTPRARNNVLINQLEFNSKPYWVLNIYDLNHEKRPDCLYLRYVLVVEDTPEAQKILARTAQWVLDSEGERMGPVEITMKQPHGNPRSSACSIVCPPITCYLFLRSNKRSKLVYSPFKHDKKKEMGIELPSDPFELLQFALYDKGLHKVIGTYKAYYSGHPERCLLKLGEPGSNTVQEFMNENINSTHAWGEIRSGEPLTCRMELIKEIIDK